MLQVLFKSVTDCICDTDTEDMVLFPSVDSSGDELSEDPGGSLICLSAPLLSWVNELAQSVLYHIQ